MSLLGIDIGSGSCKGVVFNTAGQQLASASVAYQTVSTAPAFVEIDATIFSNAVFEVIRKLGGRVTDDPIEAIAVSSHGETIIPVDAEGDPVAPAIMNSDNRAVGEAEWWQGTFGAERIYEITGVPLHAMFSLNKIMWLRKHRPEIYQNTHKFLGVGDYILAQLKLLPYTDYSLASRTMAFDVSNCCWSDEILGHCNIPKDKLPTPVPSGTLAGKLSKEIAVALGLNEGVAVALGGHDQPCGAFGAGATGNGDVYDSAGTYECLVAVTDQAMNTPAAFKYSLNSYRHVIPGKFVTLAFFPAGLVSSWFIEQFCHGENMHEILAENITKYTNGPTGLCVTPHFIGSCTPHWNVNARGTMAGFTPSITRHHMYKAIYEGIACELRINTEALEEITGPFGSMNISGGNSRSQFTVQLRSDITGKTIHSMKSDESVCLGAAMLAGMAIGKFAGAADAVQKMVHTAKTYIPDTQMQQSYEKQLERYRLLYP